MTRRFKHKLTRLVVTLGLIGTSSLPLIAIRGCGPWWEAPRRLVEM